jgi:uncharacterized protein (DUF1015 family)
MDKDKETVQHITGSDHPTLIVGDYDRVIKDFNKLPNGFSILNSNNVEKHYKLHAQVNVLVDVGMYKEWHYQRPLIKSTVDDFVREFKVCIVNTCNTPMRGHGGFNCNYNLSYIDYWVAITLLVGSCRR